MSQGAEPSEHRQASRCRRSTETTREGRQPNLRHQCSSRADTANPTDMPPPQEQDGHLEPERVRNPLRGTCGRIRRGKPQVPQEEAQKPTPVSGSINAYPAQSRRREGRHSSATSERTLRNAQGQPGRRASSKNCKANHRRRPSVGQADGAKRQHHNSSQGTQSQA